MGRECRAAAVLTFCFRLLFVAKSGVMMTDIVFSSVTSIILKSDCYYGLAMTMKATFTLGRSARSKTGWSVASCSSMKSSRSTSSSSSY